MVQEYSMKAFENFDGGVSHMEVLRGGWILGLTPHAI